MTLERLVWCGVVVVGLTVGCGKKESAPAPSAEPSAKAASTTGASASGEASAARKYFKQKCVVCHGEEGMGDGPGAAALNPKPRAFSDKEWQKSVDDAYLKKIIVGGGSAVGKSNIMPGNPDLEDPDKAEVVAELVKLVRRYGE
ncbi:MAG: c-type cytochrome [Polyangiaceae bacterium]|nr:c-type cytochrome [Polyangiaceae bacterium]